MTRRIVTIIALIAFVNFLMGCSREVVKVVPGDQYGALPQRTSAAPIQTPSEKILQLTLLGGQVIVFNEGGGFYRPTYGDQLRVIVGTKDDGVLSVTPVEKVLEARILKYETTVAGTILLTIGVLAGIALVTLLVVAATKQSCPFVYSYDGENWTFDGEPYGGAITRGLQKTDYSRLEHLKPVNGEYQLLVRNEADETQHTDEMKLLIVDHPDGTQIAPTYAGTMCAFSRALPPLSVTDETGEDLSSFFRDRDEVKWQTHLPADSQFLGKDLRHHLTLTFPRPRNSSHAKLLVNAGTALWGSNMIKQMLLLRGNKVDAWYADIDRHGQELSNLYYFMEREELYTMKVNVWEKSGWVQRAVMNAGGPLIDEDRVVDIDLGHAEGDSIRIRLNPPFGYWKIDYIGLIDDTVSISSIKELSPIWGADQQGQDVTQSLASSDGNYYSMPDVGNWSKLGFVAPPAMTAPGMKRTVYLRSTGYYDLHLRKDAPEQTALIQELGLKPGKIVEYSLRCYLDWRSKQLSVAK
jgi:hypothetical protein